MATSASASIPEQAEGQTHRFRPLHEIRAFWRDFIAAAFHPYRPELHYMRGPGPAWRAKHGERLPSRSR